MSDEDTGVSVTSVAIECANRTLESLGGTEMDEKARLREDPSPFKEDWDDLANKLDRQPTDEEQATFAEQFEVHIRECLDTTDR